MRLFFRIRRVTSWKFISLFVLATLAALNFPRGWLSFLSCIYSRTLIIPFTIFGFFPLKLSIMLLNFHFVWSRSFELSLHHHSSSEGSFAPNLRHFFHNHVLSVFPPQHWTSRQWSTESSRGPPTGLFFIAHNLQVSCRNSDSSQIDPFFHRSVLGPSCPSWRFHTKCTISFSFFPFLLLHP